MSVIVKSGEGWINGYWYQNTEDLVKTLSAADPDNDRIDRIVLRLDTTTELEITAEVLEGTPAGEPIAPTLTQTDAIYEISLAQVLVGAAVTSIADADITDERDYASVSRVDTLYVNLSPVGAEILSSNSAEKVQDTDMTNFEPWVLRFDPDTQEFAYWRFIVPPTYQSGELQASVHYKTSVNSGVVRFVIFLAAVADGETYDVNPTSVGMAGNDTVPGTAGQKGICTLNSSGVDLVAGDEVIIELLRNAHHANDTCTADVDVTMVEIREV